MDYDSISHTRWKCEYHIVDIKVSTQGIIWESADRRPGNTAHIVQV